MSLKTIIHLLIRFLSIITSLFKASGRGASKKKLTVTFEKEECNECTELEKSTERRKVDDSESTSLSGTERDSA